MNKRDNEIGIQLKTPILISDWNIKHNDINILDSLGSVRYKNTFQIQLYSIKTLFF